MAQRELDNQILVNLPEFADMERERLALGLNAEGKKLTRNDGSEHPYSRAYARKKRSLGGQTSFVDLNLTGEYTSKIKGAKIGQGRATLFSTDKKDQFLPKQYDGVHGLTPNQIQGVEQQFGEILEVKIKNHILQGL